MPTVLFITEDYLKDYTPISQNLKWSVPLSSATMEAQIKYIKPTLCDQLYIDLSDQIQNNTLTPENQALLDEYLRPALAYFTVYTLVPMSVFKLRDAGLVNQTGQNYNSVSALGEIEYFRNFALESANNYLILSRDKIAELCGNDCHPCGTGNAGRVYKKYIMPL